MKSREAPETAGRAASRGIAVMTLMAVGAFLAAGLIGLVFLALVG